MSFMRKIGIFIFIIFAAFASGAPARSQQTQYPKPTDLPNPYRLVEGWPTLPKNMNGGHWGEVIRVHVEPNGNVWVLHRCFSVVPPGHATCVQRGADNPPILEFNPAGNLIKSFGAGIFAYPHGFTVDRHGDLWATDVNDEPQILGLSAKNADGVVMGQEVLKLSPNGKVLMTIGKEGFAATGSEGFDRPTGVAIAPNGDIFVSDGHYPNKFHTARVVKFSKDGKFIKSWGSLGSDDGQLDEPHDICIGGSQESRVRRGPAQPPDRRLRSGRQVRFASWKQFGQPSSVFVGKDGTIYVGASFSGRERSDRIAGASTCFRKCGRLHRSHQARNPRHRGRRRQGRLAESVHSRSRGPGQDDGRRFVGFRHCGE